MMYWAGIGAVFSIENPYTLQCVLCVINKTSCILEKGREVQSYVLKLFYHFLYLQITMARREVYYKNGIVLSLVFLISAHPITILSGGDSIVLPIQIRSNPILPHFSDYSTNGNNQANN